MGPGSGGSQSIETIEVWCDIGNIACAAGAGITAYGGPQAEVGRDLGDDADEA